MSTSLNQFLQRSMKLFALYFNQISHILTVIYDIKSLEYRHIRNMVADRYKNRFRKFLGKRCHLTKALSVLGCVPTGLLTLKLYIVDKKKFIEFEKSSEL